MKKILIVSHALELGGAERSLIGLLDAIDKKEYKVDLFLLRHEGELLSFIPEGVNLLPEIPAYTVLACPMVQTLKEGHVILTAARMLKEDENHLHGIVKLMFQNAEEIFKGANDMIEHVILDNPRPDAAMA